MIKILIADDHDILRAGLKHILGETGDIHVGAEAADGHEALAKIRSEKWDAVVLDLTMPGRNGIELIRLVKSEFPRLPILILSMHKEDIYAIRVLKAGAAGYLCKDNAETQLADAVRRVAAGGLFINQAVAEKMARDMLCGQAEATPHQNLTDREHQIFLCIARGQGITDIAKELNLSVKTISTHKTRILEKMDLPNTAALIRYAMRHQLVEEFDSPDA